MAPGHTRRGEFTRSLHPLPWGGKHRIPRLGTRRLFRYSQLLYHSTLWTIRGNPDPQSPRTGDAASGNHRRYKATRLPFCGPSIWRDFPGRVISHPVMTAGQSMCADHPVQDVLITRCGVYKSTRVPQDCCMRLEFGLRCSRVNMETHREIERTRTQPLSTT